MTSPTPAERDLPPLSTGIPTYDRLGKQTKAHYTADQMHAYARAALASSPARPRVETTVRFEGVDDTEEQWAARMNVNRRAYEEQVIERAVREAADKFGLERFACAVAEIAQAVPSPAPAVTKPSRLADALERGSIAVGRNGEWVSIRRHIRDEAAQALRCAVPSPAPSLTDAQLIEVVNVWYEGPYRPSYIALCRAAIAAALAAPVAQPEPGAEQS